MRLYDHLMTHNNLHFDSEYDFHMSSKIYENTIWILLIILY